MNDNRAGRSGIPRDFYDFVPRPARFVLYLAIFSIFAAIGLLLDLAAASHARSWLRVLSWSGIGGVVAVGWAYAYIRNLNKFIFAAVWVPATLIAFGIARPPIRFDAAVLPSAVACLVAVVVGYILFVMFIRNQASTTMRLLTEMTLARQIHDSLTIPIHKETNHLEFYGRSVASQEMGGDLLDVVERDGNVDVFLGDVSGHGVRAGVVMGMVKSAIRMKLREQAELDQICGDLNRVLNEVSTPEMFVTFAAMRFGAAGSVQYASAGHLPIIHVRSSDGSISELEEAGLPLGVVDTEIYSIQQVEARPGDLFVLVTDGLTEVFERAGEQFGWGRVVGSVRSFHALPLPRIYDGLMRAVGSHGPQSDDQTVILIRVKR